VSIVQVGVEELRPSDRIQDLAGRDLVRLTIEDGLLVAYGFGGQEFTVPLVGDGPQAVTLMYYRVQINQYRYYRNYTGLAVLDAWGVWAIDIRSAWDMDQVHRFAETHGLNAVDRTDTPLSREVAACLKLRTTPIDKWLTDLLTFPIFPGFLAMCVLGFRALGVRLDSVFGWSDILSNLLMCVGYMLGVVPGAFLWLLVSSLFRRALRSLLLSARRRWRKRPRSRGSIPGVQR
jgi:hypothetical protein